MILAKEGFTICTAYNTRPLKHFFKKRAWMSRMLGLNQLLGINIIRLMYHSSS